MEQKIEIWRDIPGYEVSYQVSNQGRVKSLLRNRVLKPRSRGKYFKVALFTNGKRKEESIHRLVALAFLPNPNNYPVINHKDENPGNNHVDNLEWCTVEYNYKYSEKTRLKNLRKAVREKESWRKGMDVCKKRETWRFGCESMKRAVIQLDLNGNEITRYSSLSEASRAINGFGTKISECCRGKRKTHKGYKWKWK